MDGFLAARGVMRQRAAREAPSAAAVLPWGSPEAYNSTLSSARSPDARENASVPALRSLEKKVDEIAAELLAQAARVTKLEEETGTMKPRVLQEKEDQLLRLLQVQQEELERLRLKQELLASQCQRPREDGEQPVVATRSLEVQLKDLVMELKVLQQEQHLQQRHEFALTSVQQLQTETSVDCVEMLKELREERGFVSEMLDNCKREKCEVISMMHSFAMEKGEAFQELEGLRRVARDEVAAIRASSPYPNKVERDELCEETSSLLPVMMPAPPLSPQHGDGCGLQLREQAQRRQSSRPSLCTTTTVPPPNPMVATTSPPSTGSWTVAGMVQPFMVSASSMPQGTRRVCSPVRQYSANVAPGIFPVSVACSPTVMTRSTAGEPGPRPSQASVDPRKSPVSTAGEVRTLQNSIDTKKSPVRRFVSTGGMSGLSPRVHDSLGPSAGWSAMSQGTLAR